MCYLFHAIICLPGYNKFVVFNIMATKRRSCPIVHKFLVLLRYRRRRTLCVLRPIKNSSSITFLCSGFQKFAYKVEVVGY